MADKFPVDFPAPALDVFWDAHPLPGPRFCEILLYPYDPFSYFIQASSNGYLLFATKRTLTKIHCLVSLVSQDLLQKVEGFG